MDDDHSETCGAAKTTDDGTTYYCTLPPDHTPTTHHRVDYMEIDPTNPPFTRAASYEWDE